MSVRGDRRSFLGITKLAAIACISPLIAGSWVVLNRGTWKYKLFTLSVCGNVLFALVLVVGYLEARNPEHPDVPETGAVVAPECIQRPQGPLHFCQAPPESELARIITNAIYVEFGGTIRASFEFVDEHMDVLKEVTISDGYGRPWINATLDDRTMIYTRYHDEGGIDPVVSLLDTDGDGIPDVMVNYELQNRFEREEEVKWRRTRSR